MNTTFMHKFADASTSRSNANSSSNSNILNKEYEPEGSLVYIFFDLLDEHLRRQSQEKFESRNRSEPFESSLHGAPPSLPSNTLKVCLHFARFCSKECLFFVCMYVCERWLSLSTFSLLIWCLQDNEANVCFCIKEIRILN